MWDLRCEIVVVLQTREIMSEAGYKGLEVYQRAHRLAVEIHRMTALLPRQELYEEGAQIRRSSKSVAAQIVEGYCLRKNRNEFLQYLNRAYASAHETVEHLQLLRETGSLGDQEVYRRLNEECEALCKMLFRFMEGVMDGHDKPFFVRETAEEFGPSEISNLESEVPNLNAQSVSPQSPIPHPKSG